MSGFGDIRQKAFFGEILPNTDEPTKGPLHEDSTMLEEAAAVEAVFLGSLD